ncbi:MAG: hypothetical protein ACI9UJ_001097 [bacterium]|jgi:hypothetical protein
MEFDVFRGMIRSKNSANVDHYYRVYHQITAVNVFPKKKSQPNGQDFHF